MQKYFAFPIFFFIGLSTAGCGDAHDEPVSPPVLHISFLGNGETEYRPSAEGASSDEPATLILTLLGPDGSRTEVIDFAERKVALGELRQGTWTIRGDGLDAAGNLRWQAKPVTFSVRPGKTTQIQIEFQPMVNQDE